MRRMGRRTLRKDDGAITEVIGYVLSFALSAIFLIIALNAFWSARANTDDVTAAVELKSIADRVASRVVEASLVAQEFPNATLTLQVDIPQQVNDRSYYVEATEYAVYVNTSDGTLSANATTFKLEAVSGVQVIGKVHSDNERLLVVARPLTATTTEIRIREE